MQGEGIINTEEGTHPTQIQMICVELRSEDCRELLLCYCWYDVYIDCLQTAAIMDSQYIIGLTIIIRRENSMLKSVWDSIWILNPSLWLSGSISAAMCGDDQGFFQKKETAILSSLEYQSGHCLAMTSIVLCMQWFG